MAHSDNHHLRAGGRAGPVFVRHGQGELNSWPALHH